MTQLPFMTKEELIRELGISKSTFYRWLKALNIKTTRKLVSYPEAQRIRQALEGLTDITSEPPMHNINDTN